MSKGQHPGFSFEQPTHGYSRIAPLFTVTEANCGEVQEPWNRNSPVNWASGGLLGRVTAAPSLPIVEVGDLVESPVCPELALEVFAPVLVLVTSAHPIKLGIVIFTPAHNCELKDTASARLISLKFDKGTEHNSARRDDVLFWSSSEHLVEMQQARTFTYSTLLHRHLRSTLEHSPWWSVAFPKHPCWSEASLAT